MVVINFNAEHFCNANGGAIPRTLSVTFRVGIGLDSVPLTLCKTKGITVCYTPDAVTKAASELMIGAMVSMTRFIPQADRNTRK